MSLALSEAWKYQGLTYPNPAVGCTIVGKNSQLLAVEAHQKAGLAHAEVLALQTAYSKLTNDTKILELKQSNDIHQYLLKHHNSCFKDIELYTTLEPCSHVGKTPSCASLISKLGVKKVFIGSNDFNEEASNGKDILSTCRVEVEENIMRKECDELLEPFKLWSEKRFVFFKMAQRLDGSNDGEVSSKTSRTTVHAMRDICDLLVIGGNSVRIDRPILDARLVDGKAPDILIVSKEKEFDKSIALFNVKGRKVFIESDFKRLDDYKNIMIEGTQNMRELSKSFVDYELIYLATNEKVLNIQKDTQDIIMWMKRES
ncbi:MAG: bifunctional diaminohydroxyphosphoribosylaminopyrimidine deaminase/5-amino-6-(5-phosphoribosylamino)uracil reductase RibD [Campylobacterota bacterium]|nr:bifunctional diaminohydroxyphosphoribosylaminopyrimidine deaminase/5-amino-6-(5-phosphoribosylamino)uracil reductase RibD [Campylobacterota bacterium]